ncbi:MAG: serine hydrolase domain-containing protein [Chthoniobacterales bacterium]
MKRAAILVFLSFACILYAQGPAPSPLASPFGSPAAAVKAEESPDKPHALTRDDLESFLDGLIPSQLETRNGAGAVIGAVKDGQVLLTKGYGFADYAARKPVLPSVTLFRPGSISKLFTATAVMQLVEQGKLDLDTDVAKYLDFEIRRTYPEPITLRRILTHTGGFEETLKNLFVARAEAMRPLHDYLVASMPAQIFPPGKVPSYSNWALSVAGYIVERTSGEPFDSYVDEHILRPLRMQNSTFHQPLPTEIAPQMSNGYRFAGEHPLPFEFVQAAPAGALSATADDMCRFMLAFLNKGSLEEATILKPGTVQQMLSRQFEAHAALNAIGLVFMQYDMNGIPAWGHGGDTIAFHSDLWLVPDAQFGFFISYNSAAPKPGGGRGEVMRALFERYFAPVTPPLTYVDEATARNDARAVAGVYESSRRGETTLLKTAALLGELTVRPNADGTIGIDASKNQRGQVRRWRETEPLVFREVNGPEKIAFVRDASGRVTDLLPQPVIVEATRVKWYDSEMFLLLFVGSSVGLIVLTIVLWPVAALIRRRYSRRLFDGAPGRGLFVTSRLACLGVAIWLLLIAIATSRAGTDISMIGDPANPWLSILHLLGWATAIGTVFVIIATVRFAGNATLGLWLRAHTGLLALALLAFVWFMWHCHLLDPSLKF